MLNSLQPWLRDKFNYHGSMGHLETKGIINTGIPLLFPQTELSDWLQANRVKCIELLRS